MLFFLLALVGLAIACADSDLEPHSRNIGPVHTHVYERNDHPQFPVTTPDRPLRPNPPYRPLVWGDFNVIHTTDTHGWLLGHQKPTWPEPNYSGNLGDFASFITHMKQIAIEKDVDLLLVDSGDLHDGTGLSDGYPPGGINAHESNKFIERLPYDVMAIGNHELYHYVNAYDMYTNFAPRLNGRYLSSNVNITVFSPDGEVVSVPVGNRYAKFTTRKGRKVTSLGVLYDFKGNSINTTVQLVADMVKEQWFVDAIEEEPDVFLLVGHMPVSYDNWPIISDAIRVVHPCAPIMIFGGHSHVRDCQQYDGRSMGLTSGRYMETIGWMSAEVDAAKGNTNNITFTRRYLDQNRVTYEYHTATSNSTFDTLYGRSITHGLQELARDFDLAHLYGTAPHDYTTHQNPYPSSKSILTLFAEKAAPVALSINNTRTGIPRLIISNSGGLRFNIYKGPFTKNDQLTASPFSNSFVYIPNVTASVANQVLLTLNYRGSAKHSDLEEELWGRGYVHLPYHAWLEDMAKRQPARAVDTTNLTPGYVTMDGCPDSGDDTLHVPLPFFPFPEYIGSIPPNVTGDTPIDLVFIEFIESQVLSVLNEVQSATNYVPADVSLYTPTLSNAVLGLYAEAEWN